MVKRKENEGEFPSGTEAASTSSFAAMDALPPCVCHRCRLREPLVVPSKAADWSSDKMGCCVAEALRSANRCELLDIGAVAAEPT
ncbi:hypothetical protein QJS10_CPB12g01275 [Acorus calamus]|uniref:Uncharacterized protein n=1 Tax=Acorus calamus TaxID=4465 RepID=A0AAV9DM05_ACOCL|nr:hypothetical protein QJS10_CPB12g01275 [Acorus calamus]